MDEREFLAEQFEEHRTRLRAVAYRMLGSLSEADDAVQEAWLRLSRTDSDEVDNLGGWLTTVVARVSLNMLRSRRSSTARPTPRASSPAAHAAAFGLRTPSPTPTWTLSERSSRRSSRPPATGTSTDWLPSSTPMSSSERTSAQPDRRKSGERPRSHARPGSIRSSGSR